MLTVILVGEIVCRSVCPRKKFLLLLQVIVTYALLTKEYTLSVLGCVLALVKCVVHAISY